MSHVKENDRIIISFIGKLDNGLIFKEISPSEPITVQLGDSELPPTVEIEVIGMQQGQTKKIRVSPDEGYGPRMKELLQEVTRKSFGDHIDPKPGMVLTQAIEREGVAHKVPATVLELKDDMVVLDYNHPLAGHHLTYELTVVKIES